jgi:hypothetical protein
MKDTQSVPVDLKENILGELEEWESSVSKKEVSKTLP